MNKAILVMDMPSCCVQCCLSQAFCGAYACTQLEELIIEEESCHGRIKRYSKCPLKEVPEKKEPNSFTDSVYFVALGYNACIDDILGGSNE